MTVSAVIEVLQALPGGDPVDWLTDELAEAVPAVLGTQSQLASLFMQIVAAFDARGGAQQAGFRGTTDWLTTTARMSHAGALVQTARALRDELPVTAGALASGGISEEHVRVIRRAHRMLGTDFADIEAEVVGVAGQCTAKELRQFVDVIIQQYCPQDADEQAETAHQKRKVLLSRSLDGWWHLNGLLDPATGEKLKAAFDVFADATGPEDLRTPAARRADALAEIADRALAGVDRPSGHGHVMLHLTQEQADSRLGVVWPSGSLLSRAEVDQHTCEAEVAVMVHDPVTWEPLRLGMTARFASKAQRMVLQARDGDTCVHPGCSVQASRCIAHHIEHWDRGGPTDVDNMVLVCQVHHRLIHRERLHIVEELGRYTTARRRLQPA